MPNRPHRPPRLFNLGFDDITKDVIPNVQDLLLDIYRGSLDMSKLDTHTHTCIQHTCTHTCTQHTHVHTHMYTHTCTHTCIQHTCTHTCTQHTHVHTHMYTHTCTHTHVHTHMYTHMYTHTCTQHTHIHTHTHTHTHTHYTFPLAPVYLQKALEEPVPERLVCFSSGLHIPFPPLTSTVHLARLEHPSEDT